MGNVQREADLHKGSLEEAKARGGSRRSESSRGGVELLPSTPAL